MLIRFSLSYRQQSEEFYQVLQECKLPVKHHVYNNIPHAGFVVDWADNQTATQVSKSLISSRFDLCLLLYVIRLVAWLKHSKPSLSLCKLLLKLQFHAGQAL